MIEVKHVTYSPQHFWSVQSPCVVCRSERSSPVRGRHDVLEQVLICCLRVILNWLIKGRLASDGMLITLEKMFGTLNNSEIKSRYRLTITRM